MLTFTKSQGIGNDFIIIENLSDEISLDAYQVSALCDRRFGIGADGLMLVAGSTVADFRMDFRNSDGSTAEMCGNGIRCFAKYLMDRGLSSGESVSIETGSGVKSVNLTQTHGVITGAVVEMGVPELAAEKIPVSRSLDKLNRLTLSTGTGEVTGTCVSMGNPHFVVFVDDPSSFPVARLGAEIETDAAFPKRTNVEFAKVHEDGEIELRVWERGVGETLACGTGACATAVAAALSGLIDARAGVNLPGGRLEIELTSGNRVLMAGPATEVYRGEIQLERSSAPAERGLLLE